MARQIHEAKTTFAANMEYVIAMKVRSTPYPLPAMLLREVIISSPLKLPEPLKHCCHMTCLALICFILASRNLLPMD